MQGQLGPHMCALNAINVTFVRRPLLGQRFRPFSSSTITAVPPPLFANV